MIDRLLIASEMLDPEVVQELAADLRQNGGVARSIAAYSIPGLLDLYLEKLLFAAQEQGASAIALRFPHITISETPDGDTTHLHVDAEGLDSEMIVEEVTPVVQESMDELDLWRDLVEWTLSNLFVWTADEIAEEYGAARFAALSDDEFVSACQVRWAADSNQADKPTKATEALHIYAQEIAQLFIKAAHGVPSSQLGVLLGFPPELTSPAELDSARREAVAKLTEAFTTWKTMEQMLGDSPSAHARPRQSNAGRPKQRNQFPREVCDEFAREALALQADGMTWEEITERTGLPAKTLRRYIKQLRERGGP